MTIPRYFGQILLHGTARKSISQGIYQEYTLAKRALEASGALQGLTAEIKLKTKQTAKSLFTQNHKDFLQLSYQDANGIVQKMALDTRRHDQNVHQYLEAAIERAKTITGNDIRTGMARSNTNTFNDYREIMGALQPELENLPANSKFKIKRNPITGRKIVKISTPILQPNGEVQVLKQTIKKPRKANIQDFARNAAEHANLVFENAINPMGKLSARQVPERLTAHLENAAAQLTATYNNGYANASGLFNPAGILSANELRAMKTRAAETLNQTLEVAEQQIQHQKMLLTQQVAHLRQAAAQSPSRVKPPAITDDVARGIHQHYDARQAEIADAQFNRFQELLANPPAPRPAQAAAPAQPVAGNPPPAAGAPQAAAGNPPRRRRFVVPQQPSLATRIYNNTLGGLFNRPTHTAVPAAPRRVRFAPDVRGGLD